MKNLLTKFRKAWARLLASRRPAEKQKNDSREDLFVDEWTSALKENAKVFNGLYGGLQRVVDGKAKKPESVIAEWWTRTRYEWENQPLAEISRERWENVSVENCAKWASLLLNAAAGAGITKEQSETIVLNEISSAAYVEWDGKEIFIGDTVKVMNPAWYQNGRVIEQGHCMLLKEGGEL